MKISRDAQIQLEKWYLENARPLPWRQTQDPYKIWISEVMLQQTVSTAVIPYYEKFISTFPNLNSLAAAPEDLVLELWSGLGYYSRARNLHAAAKALARTQFPRSHTELIKFKGFGPYTSRAVSSIAFHEPVGVLDGNVIRILARIHGFKKFWWKTQHREELQKLSDLWVQNHDSRIMNQALMELGATLCQPKNPSCLICPVRKFCYAFKNQKQNQLPIKKPRKAKEVWLWSPRLLFYKDALFFVKNEYAPFLRGQFIFPGSAKKMAQPPAVFKYKHNVTHHEIYVRPRLEKVKSSVKIPISKGEWIHLKNIKKTTPQTLILKALRLYF